MDDDNETGMTPEERRRWRVRRGMKVRPLSEKQLKAKARRKARLRRKRNGSVQRRRVSGHDGRLAWVKNLKAKGLWIPYEEYTKQMLPSWMDDDSWNVEITPPPPSSPPIYRGLSLSPRVEQGTVRQSFSKGRCTVVVEKRERLAVPERDGLFEPLPQPLNIIPPDKV